MADYEPVEVEQSGSSEGQVVVDIGSIPDTQQELVRARLLRMFTSEVIRVKDANGNLMPYGVEVVECKVCGAMLQKLVGPLLRHAGYHEKEIRAVRSARRR